MTTINQTVNVNSFYFKTAKSAGGLRTYPRSVDFGDRTVSFQDGLRYLVHRGQRIVQLFDMTDGNTMFRLKFEDDQWTLVGTRAAVQL